MCIAQETDDDDDDDRRMARMDSRSRPDLGSGRRSFLKGSALATGAFYINARFPLGMLRGDAPASPATTPFLEPLAFPRYAMPP